MTATPKLRSVKPTAKEEIAQLKERVTNLEADRDHWKQEAVEAEQKIQEALRVLGYDPVFYDLVEAAKLLRTALGVADDNKLKLHTVAADKMSELESAERAERDREAAEERAADLETRLSDALDDREALLRHAGLTDYAWYMLGGRPESTLSPEPSEE